MRFLFKAVVMLLLLGAAAYGTFFVRMADKTLAQHAQEVWRAPVLQQKIGLLREGVRTKVDPSLRQAKERVSQEIADMDRASLQRLIVGNDKESATEPAAQVRRERAQVNARQPKAASH